MGMIDIPKPTEGQFHPSAAGYVGATARYLESTGTSVQDMLERQPAQFTALLAGANPALSSFAYAPGKWTLSESIVHMSDTERVFAYRLMRIARGDSTPLPGFDQDAWVPESRSAERSLESVMAEFLAVRNATLALVHSLDAVAVSRQGTASNHPVLAAALVWMIAGHAAHHFEIISERYLRAAAGH
jgi:hypothetical protein